MPHARLWATAAKYQKEDWYTPRLEHLGLTSCFPIGNIKEAGPSALVHLMDSMALGNDMKRRVTRNWSMTEWSEWEYLSFNKGDVRLFRYHPARFPERDPELELVVWLPSQCP